MFCRGFVQAVQWWFEILDPAHCFFHYAGFVALHQNCPLDLETGALTALDHELNQIYSPVWVLSHHIHWHIHQVGIERRVYWVMQMVVDKDLKPIKATGEEDYKLDAVHKLIIIRNSFDVGVPYILHRSG